MGEFDAVIHHGFLSAVVGSDAYRSLLGLNRFVRTGCTKYPASRIAHERKDEDGQGAAPHRDGIVCGRIHNAELVERDGLVYCNDGDWVESCTALVEQQNGALELVTWRPQAGRPSRERSRLLDHRRAGNG